MFIPSFLTKKYKPGSLPQILVGKFWEAYKSFFVRVAKLISWIDGFGTEYRGQYAEDLWIRHFLRHDIKTYIDIGANEPEFLNNTWIFYRDGARGVNVEPNEDIVKMLNKKRPEDVNLCVGVGAKEGKMKLHKFGAHQICSFIDSDIEKNRQVHGYTGSVEVPIVTLSGLMEKYGVPDLLAIDVEGMDEDVIEGNDWVRFRPQLVVIEGIHDKSMARVGYKKLLFNGLNSFYRLNNVKCV